MNTTHRLGATLALAIGLGLAAPVLASEVSCGPGGQAIVGTLPALGACIIEAAGANLIDAIQDPLLLVPAIVSACAQYGVATAEMIVSYIESFFSSAPSVDSGLAVSSVIAGRLQRVHDSASAQVARVKAAQK